MDRALQRLLRIDLPPRQSAFLWGPRKVGTSTLLRDAFPGSLNYDFLKTDLALAFGARLALLREQLLARPFVDLERPIILDEVQKVPGVTAFCHRIISPTIHDGRLTCTYGTISRRRFSTRG